MSTHIKWNTQNPQMENKDIKSNPTQFWVGPNLQATVNHKGL